MLAVSPLRRSRDEAESGGEMEGFSMVGAGVEDHEFGEFSDGNLLESINFEDLFAGINVDGDVLPDLEMDPEILAEFCVESPENMKYYSVAGENNDKITNDKVVDDQNNVVISTKEVEEDEDYGNKVSSASNSGSSRGGEESATTVKASAKQGDKGRKSSSVQSQNSQGKRKMKVDWTPELHRRFVQAVEQLGVDKAVPSRILEVMGIDCLTRHNIASHLQKYRSHRKHLLAREAEAARWSQRRQMCGGRREVSPWLAPPTPTPTPTLGFPQMVPPMHHLIRPLHVWGHPPMDHSFMPMWPNHHHLPYPLSAQPPAWVQPAASPPPPPDPSFWYPHHQQRFGSPPVPGIPPPHAMFKADPGIGVPTGQPGPRPVLDFYPSKESIDAAIGDVLSKPWMPLPLGLKAPALDAVLAELQRQGIPKIPPSSA